MMLRFFSLFFLISLLQGCAYLHSLSSDLPQKIDQWVAEQEYGKALETLSHVPRTHKNFSLLQKKRHAILLQAKDFELNQHLAAQVKEKQGHTAKTEQYRQVSLQREGGQVIFYI